MALRRLHWRLMVECIVAELRVAMEIHTQDAGTAVVLRIAVGSILAVGVVLAA